MSIQTLLRQPPDANLAELGEGEAQLDATLIRPTLEQYMALFHDQSTNCRRGESGTERRGVPTRRPTRRSAHRRSVGRARARSLGSSPPCGAGNY